MSESEEFENFTDAHSSSNDKNSPLEIFSIEGPSSIDIDNNSEGDEFYDVIDEPKFQRDNKREFVEEHEIQDSKPLPPLPPRNKNRMTILEFLQEEDEEEEEVNELETGLKQDSDLNKRETIFEFLQEYSDEEDVVDVESPSLVFHAYKGNLKLSQRDSLRLKLKNNLLKNKYLRRNVL